MRQRPDDPESCHRGRVETVTTRLAERAGTGRADVEILFRDWEGCKQAASASSATDCSTMGIGFCCHNFGPTLK